MDWSYEMRREMQEIIPGLYLGPYGVARNREKLQAGGITHILMVRSTVEKMLCVKFPENFVYKVVEVPDGPTDNMIPYFKDCNSFLQSSIAAGGKVLVHCNAGLARSAAVVIAFLMEHKDMLVETAIHHVQGIRCCIHVRDALINQLREYEAIHKTAATIQAFVPSPAAPMPDQAPARKRSLEADMDEDLDGAGGAVAPDPYAAPADPKVACVMSEADTDGMET